MTVMITRIAAPGAGPKLYPDAAMDAGCVAAFDLARSFCWGGSIPLPGAALAVGATVANLCMAEDGFSEEPASLLGAATYANSGIVFTGGSQQLRLPASVFPSVGDRRRGWVLWLDHTAPAGAASFQNSCFSIVGGDGIVQVSLVLVYTSGALSAAQIGLAGYGGSSPVLPTQMTAALGSGLPHQFGFEVERDAAATQVRAIYYLNGIAVGGSGWLATTSGWAAPTAAADLAVIGRAARWSGSGLNGHVRRFLAHNQSLNGAGSFSEIVARDWASNRARIQAAAAAA